MNTNDNINKGNISMENSDSAIANASFWSGFAASIPGGGAYPPGNPLPGRLFCVYRASTSRNCL